VQDAGIGMTPEVLTQAVDPFFTTKDVGQGTGLGLPMVFGIVQGHQGFLTIDTATGRGTCVRLHLPRLTKEGDEAIERVEFDSHIVEPENQPGRSILVIDDEEAVLDVVDRFLHIAGHRVMRVTSGQEGAELLAQGKSVDLVILDVMMPREDAARTFQHLRQRRPNVPVLLCTGLPDMEPAPGLLREGGVSLIRKPFRMNELWYAVKEALRKNGASGS
jgi:CheY-like chemotaxis protein